MHLTVLRLHPTFTYGLHIISKIMYFSGEDRRRIVGGLQLLGVVTFLTLASPATSRTLDIPPPGPMELQPEGVMDHHAKVELEDLHPIDVCIISCDLCFKNEALVSCANACITSDGVMDRNWRRICKVFDGPTHRFGFH